jgi:RecJ-like exonuclease
MDAETLSDLLNACGREKMGGTGVGICLGNGDSLAYARELNYTSRRDVIEATVELDKMGVTPMENIQFFDSTSTGFTGILCNIVMHYMGDPNKPTIGINYGTDGKAKASARGTWDQLDNGIDLSVAMRDASESVGGQGGGHRIASGANFPSSRGQEFLKKLNEIVGEQKVNHAK